MTKAQRHLREDQLYRAAFTATRRQARRRRALVRLLNKYPRHPEVAYYLAVGAVPRSLFEQG